MRERKTAAEAIISEANNILLERARWKKEGPKIVIDKNSVDKKLQEQAYEQAVLETVVRSLDSFAEKIGQAKSIAYTAKPDLKLAVDEDLLEKYQISKKRSMSVGS